MEVLFRQTRYNTNTHIQILVKALENVSQQHVDKLFRRRKGY